MRATHGGRARVSRRTCARRGARTQKFFCDRDPARAARIRIQSLKDRGAKRRFRLSQVQPAPIWSRDHVGAMSGPPKREEREEALTPENRRFVFPQGGTPAVTRELDAPLAGQSSHGNAVALATAKAHRQRFEDGWSNGGNISGKSLALLAKVTPRSSEHTGVRLSQLVWQRGEEASALGGRQSGTPRGCSARLRIAPPAAIDPRAVHGYEAGG